MKFLKVRCLKLLLHDISSTEFLYNRINKNKMIEISRRRMDTFRCEILRINPYSVARSCQRTLESLISMRGFWCTSGCVTSRYGFHGSPTIPRRHELERIGRSSFQKEIFIRFHKQNKNFEISFQKMDFNFAFTNREKGNVRTKWWNTSVILLLQIILISLERVEAKLIVLRIKFDLYSELYIRFEDFLLEQFLQ